MEGRKLSRRDFLKLAGIAGAGAMLAACAQEAPVVEEEPTDEGAPAEQIAVRYLVNQWASTVDRRVERQVAFRSVIDAFNVKFADKGWEIEEIPFDGNSVTLTQEIEAGNIDAMWYNRAEYGNRKRADQLLDLTEALDGGEDEFFDWVTEMMKSVDGQIASLWHNTDTPLYYYNTEKIADPPEKWMDVIAICEKVRMDEGGDKYAFTHPFAGWLQMNSGMFVALGGEYVNEEGAPVAFEPENVEIWKYMFEYYIGLLEDDLIPAAAVANNQIQQLPDVYAGNVYSFAGNSNHHTRQLLPNLPEGEYEKWSAQPLPYPDRAPNGLYEAGGWVIGAAQTGDGARQEAAAAWVMHATGATSQAVTNKAGGWIPTRPGVMQDDAFYKEDHYAQVTLEALNNGYVVPLDAIYSPMTTAIGTALTRAATGEATIDAALTDAAAETDREWDAIKGG